MGGDDVGDEWQIDRIDLERVLNNRIELNRDDSLSLAEFLLGIASSDGGEAREREERVVRFDRNRKISLYRFPFFLFSFFLASFRDFDLARFRVSRVCVRAFVNRRQGRGKINRRKP